jgi:glycosyltransferase involved in cell wall biosynthesis
VKVSIVLPCFNEGGSLNNILDDAKKLVTQNSNYEVIFVNNGSTDNSQEILERFYESSSFKDSFKIVWTKENLGYGGGILYGLSYAKADILAFSHADEQTSIFDVVKGIEKWGDFSNSHRLIKGRRIKRNLFDKIFSLGMEYYIFLKLKIKLHDINAQPKIFHRNFYETYLKKAPKDFSLDLFILIMAKKYGQIKEFDVRFKKRTVGEAKGGGSLKGKYNLIKRTIVFTGLLKETLKKKNSR